MYFPVIKDKIICILKYLAFHPYINKDYQFFYYLVYIPLNSLRRGKNNNNARKEIKIDIKMSYFYRNLYLCHCAIGELLPTDRYMYKKGTTLNLHLILSLDYRINQGVFSLFKIKQCYLLSYLYFI